MATLRINSNDTFSIDITVRESDKYTESVYVRVDRYYAPEDVSGCNEFFLKSSELDRLGRFLILQAEEINQTQVNRGRDK